MSKVNLAIIGFNSKYNEFLSHIKKNKINYKISFITKFTDIDKIKNFKTILSQKKISMIIVCNQKSIYYINKYIDYFIKKKIKVTQASTATEIKNHGFIIKKPFRDFSFDQFFIRKTLKTDEKILNKIFSNKTILITGGAGSIGSFVVRNICKFKTRKIIVVDNNEYNFFKLKLSLGKKNIDKIVLSLANIENNFQMEKIFKKYAPDIVFHVAALKHVEYLENNTNQGILTNVLGTENVLKYSVKNKVKYFINVSTDKAADPENILGITKLIGEYLCSSYSLKNNIKIGIVRFGNVFNSNGSVSEVFKHQLFNAGKISISHPDVKRYFMSGSEASNLILSALNIIHSKSLSKCRTFICNMGEQIKIIDIAKKMIFLSGRSNKKYLSNKYYGLKNIEKKSEKLISKNETIINTFKKRIFEIKRNKANKKILKINFNKLITDFSDKKNKFFLKKNCYF